MLPTVTYCHERLTRLFSHERLTRLFSHALLSRKTHQAVFTCSTVTKDSPGCFHTKDSPGCFHMLYCHERLTRLFSHERLTRLFSHALRKAWCVYVCLHVGAVALLKRVHYILHEKQDCTIYPFLIRCHLPDFAHSHCNYPVTLTTLTD